jgi:hypothetical protein
MALGFYLFSSVVNWRQSLNRPSHPWIDDRDFHPFQSTDRKQIQIPDTQAVAAQSAWHRLGLIVRRSRIFTISLWLASFEVFLECE